MMIIIIIITAFRGKYLEVISKFENIQLNIKKYSYLCPTFNVNIGPRRFVALRKNSGTLSQLRIKGKDPRSGREGKAGGRRPLSFAFISSFHQPMNPFRATKTPIKTRISTTIVILSRVLVQRYFANNGKAQKNECVSIH